MSSPLSLSSRRISLPQCAQISQQTRNATLIRRPKRPYTFTQLVTLTDGSTYLHRTTSPSPVYKVTKDVRNSPLWNPSSQKLLNIEEDEAGKLRAFRNKFGRGWDGETEQDGIDATPEESKKATPDAAPKAVKQESLMDLIGSYGTNEQQALKSKYLHTPQSQKKPGKK